MEKEEIEQMISQSVVAAVTPIITSFERVLPTIIAANAEKPKTEDELQREAEERELQEFTKAMKEGASPSKHNNYRGANVQEI